MKAAPTLPDEEQRSRDIKESGILDSGTDPALDAIAMIASRLFGTPMALITVVEGDQQWFKANVGMPGTGTPRDISFCGHAIADDQPFVIEDASEDVRFHDNPLVLDAPHIRFYAGQPLRNADGHAIGTLCVLDDQPRRLTPDDKRLLRALGKMAIQQIERLYPTPGPGSAMAAVDERVLKRARFWDVSLDLLCTANPKGYFVDVNPRFPELLGYTMDELLARPFLDLVHEQDVDATLAEMQNLAAGHTTIRFTNRYRRKQGDYVHLTWTAAQVGDLIYAAARDTTELHQALWDLEESGRQLVVSNRQVREVTAAISHDLRSPLHEVTAGVQLIAETAGDTLPEEAQKVLGYVQSAAHRMDAMVKMLVHYARVGARGRSEEFMVGDIVEEVTRSMGLEIENAGATVQVDGDAQVFGDPDQIQQLFSNLLGNALKYGGKGTHIEIDVKESDDRVKIRFSDDGPGVPPDWRSRVFELFAQAPRGDGPDGIGMGLAICRRIVEGHGGKIDIVDGPGAVFVFDLPSRRPTPATLPRQDLPATMEVVS